MLVLFLQVFSFNGAPTTASPIMWRCMQIVIEMYTDRGHKCQRISERWYGWEGRWLVLEVIAVQGATIHHALCAQAKATLAMNLISVTRKFNVKSFVKKHTMANCGGADGEDDRGNWVIERHRRKLIVHCAQGNAGHSNALLLVLVDDGRAFW